LFWLSAVREHCNRALQDLQNTKIDTFRKIKDGRSKYWGAVPSQNERSQINISLIPITVIGAKYDLFANAYEPKVKKLLCSALRYICHTNGCDLVFTSIKEQ